MNFSEWTLGETETEIKTKSNLKNKIGQKKESEKLENKLNISYNSKNLPSIFKNAHQSFDNREIKDNLDVKYSEDSVNCSSPKRNHGFENNFTPKINNFENVRMAYKRFLKKVKLKNTPLEKYQHMKNSMEKRRSYQSGRRKWHNGRI